MNSKRLSLLVSAAGLLLLLGLGAMWHHFHSEAAAHGGHAHGEEADESGLVLNHGKKWPTDATLRAGMGRIGDQATALLETHARGELDAARANASADAIEKEIHQLMAVCRLEPSADATLHVILTGLIRGSRGLAGDPHSAASAADLRQALERYPQYFDHAGWSERKP